MYNTLLKYIYSKKIERNQVQMNQYNLKQEKNLNRAVSSPGSRGGP